MNTHEVTAEPRLPRKHVFHNFIEVLNQSNYEELSTHKKLLRKLKPKTRDSKLSILPIVMQCPYLVKEVARMFWKMYLVLDKQQRECKHHWKHCPYSCHDLVKYTKNSTEEFIAHHCEVIDNSDKYSFCKPVDLTDIKTFPGLLYLQARPKWNLFNWKTFSHHETANHFLKQQCHWIASHLFQDL